MLPHHAVAPGVVALLPEPVSQASQAACCVSNLPQACNCGPRILQRVVDYLGAEERHGAVDGVVVQVLHSSSAQGRGAYSTLSAKPCNAINGRPSRRSITARQQAANSSAADSLPIETVGHALLQGAFTAFVAERFVTALFLIDVVHPVDSLLASQAACDAAVVLQCQVRLVAVASNLLDRLHPEVQVDIECKHRLIERVVDGRIPFLSTPVRWAGWVQLAGWPEEGLQHVFKKAWRPKQTKCQFQVGPSKPEWQLRLQCLRKPDFAALMRDRPARQTLWAMMLDGLQPRLRSCLANKPCS